MMTERIHGRYELLDEWRAGGEGTVRAALDHENERQVAVKLRPVGSEQEREALRAEPRILLDLPSHPNLPKVHDAFFDGDRHCIVMEWIDGADLQEVLDEHGDPGLPYADVLVWLDDAAAALDHLHRHDPPVFHCDVKPANLLRSATGRIVLVDFGVSARLGEAGSDTRFTPDYAAPELRAGLPPARAVDVYGLAATALALLTGSPSTVDYPAYQQLPASSVGGVHRALSRGLHPNPARRHASATELVGELHDALDAGLPDGLVTFLLTAAEPPAQRFGPLLADAVRRHNGRLVEDREDAATRIAAFSRATDATNAAVTLLRRLADEPGPKVRMALDTQETEPRGGRYPSAALERGERLRALADAGQVLVSAACASFIGDAPNGGVSLLDLGTRPLDRGRREHVALLLVPGLESRSPPASPRKGQHNLPASLSSFIGRDREVARITHLLRERQLVTLKGSGGVGKSRLAIEAARAALHRFPDGVRLVDLAAVEDPALVAQVIASVLSPPTTGDVGSFTTTEQQPELSFTERLIDALRDRQLLLVLDNCDPVVSACAELVAALLDVSPDLRVLCTGREPLDLGFEEVIPTPWLSLPPLDHGGDVDVIRDSEAVQLFLERARQKGRDLSTDPANLPVVAEICRGVEGIPFAIELAAARVRMMSLQEILERLDDQLDLLAAGRRATAPRQQTMRSMVEWSHNLLSEPEQTLLRRLSAFRGGFGLEAVQGVCSGGGLEPAVMDLLGALVDKSLVELVDTERDQPARYRLLEPMRQYAAERLSAAGERETFATRHQSWFVGLAEDAAPGLHAGDQVRQLARLDPEQDNFRAALEPDGPARTEQRLRLAVALDRFWTFRGLASEAQEHLTRVLADAHDLRTPQRAKALAIAGNFALDEGKHDEAARLSQAALALAEETGDDGSRGWALRTLGVVQWRQGDREQANETLQQALAIARDHRDRWSEAYSMARLAWIAAHSGEYKKARQLDTRGLKLRRRLGDLWGLAFSLYWLGMESTHLGRFDEAASYLDESLSSAKRLGSRQLIMLVLLGRGECDYLRDDQRSAEEHYRTALKEADALDERVSYRTCVAGLASVAIARGRPDEASEWLQDERLENPLLRYASRTALLRSFGQLARAEGRFEDAAQHFRDALALHHPSGDSQRMIERLEELALVLAARDEPQRAATLLGATESARKQRGTPVPPVYWRELEPVAAALRAATQGPEVLGAWEEGAGLSIDEVVQRELRLRDGPVTATGGEDPAVGDLRVTRRRGPRLRRAHG